MQTDFVSPLSILMRSDRQASRVKHETELIKGVRPDTPGSQSSKSHEAGAAGEDRVYTWAARGKLMMQPSSYASKGIEDNTQRSQSVYLHHKHGLTRKWLITELLKSNFAPISIF